MWRKLNSNQDIDSISEGKIIIKYPIDGEPQPEIDLSSEEIFLLYEVSQVNGAEVRLRVPPEDLKQSSSTAYLPSNSDGVVCLSKLDLLHQNVWWIS